VLLPGPGLAAMALVAEPVASAIAAKSKNNFRTT
jgi:hypothetical protein